MKTMRMGHGGVDRMLNGVEQVIQVTSFYRQADSRQKDVLHARSAAYSRLEKQEDSDVYEVCNPCSPGFQKA
jgi:hypothetical protein